MPRFVNIGFHSYINTDEILSIVPLKSLPLQKILKSQRESGELLPLTFGRATRSLIVTKSGRIIASFHESQVLIRRMKNIKAIDMDGDINGDDREISAT